MTETCHVLDCGDIRCHICDERMTCLGPEPAETCAAHIECRECHVDNTCRECADVRRTA